MPKDLVYSVKIRFPKLFNFERGGGVQLANGNRNDAQMSVAITVPCQL